MVLPTPAHVGLFVWISCSSQHSRLLRPTDQDGVAPARPADARASPSGSRAGIRTPDGGLPAAIWVRVPDGRRLRSGGGSGPGRLPPRLPAARHLSRPMQFTTWLFQIAKNRVLDELRAQARARSTPFELTEATAAPEHAPERNGEIDETIAAVWQGSPASTPTSRCPSCSATSRVSPTARSPRRWTVTGHRQIAHLHRARDDPARTRAQEALPGLRTRRRPAAPDRGASAGDAPDCLGGLGQLRRRPRRGGSRRSHVGAPG